MHLYIHIPFCKQACHYCDFHFSTQLGYKGRMVSAIIREIELQKQYLRSNSLKTIYFGGGTPSILDNNELESIFNTIRKEFDCSQLEEVTLEANPDDIVKEKLRAWKSLGVNRLSIGIQTFNDVLLKLMNRAHNSKEAETALKWAMEEGFETSSADLIYSKTGLTLNETRQHEILKDDIEKICSYGLQHISAYNLTIEKTTVFGNWTAKGLLGEINDDYAAKQYNILTESLANRGFEQYEISNFAKNKNYAVHNTSYWMGEEYLGIGPAAHSFNIESRQWNIPNNHKYMTAVEGGNLLFEKEILSINDKVNDYLLTGLRTIWGVSLTRIKNLAGTLNEEFNYNLEELEKHNRIIRKDDHIFIPKEAWIFADKIASDLFWIDD